MIDQVLSGDFYEYRIKTKENDFINYSIDTKAKENDIKGVLGDKLFNELVKQKNLKFNELGQIIFNYHDTKLENNNIC
jgi:hypothetical protein